MSHTAHIRSHRKPRRNASTTVAVRAGVAGGVLSTMAVAGAVGPANAAEPVTQTSRCPRSRPISPPQVAQSAAGHPAGALRTTSCRRRARNAAARPPRPPRRPRPRPSPRPKAEAEAKQKAEAARRAAAERAVPLRRPHHARRASARPPPSAARPSPPRPPVPPRPSSPSSRRRSATPTSPAPPAPTAWDCSGLVQAAFKHGGRRPAARLAGPVDRRHPGLPETTCSRATSCTGAARAARTTSAVYVGDGKFVGAQNPSTGVGEHRSPTTRRPARSACSDPAPPSGPRPRVVGAPVPHARPAGCGVRRAAGTPPPAACACGSPPCDRVARGGVLRATRR